MSNLSDYDRMIPASLLGLVNTQYANFGFLVFGTATCAVNVMQFVTIFKDKKLHTRCYFLIANYCVAAFLYSLSFLSIGVKRMIRLHLKIPEVNTKFVCNLEMLSAMFGQAGTVALPLVTALDRVTAAVWPLVYAKIGIKTVSVLAGLAWLFADVDSSITFIEDQSVLVANCHLASTNSLLFEIQATSEVTISVLVTLLYPFVLIVLRQKMRLAQITSETIALAKNKRQMRVARTLAVESCVHLVTQVVTRIGFTLLTPLSAEERFNYVPYIRMVVILGCGTSLLIFLCLNKDFNSAFRRTFKSCCPNSGANEIQTLTANRIGTCFI